MSNPITPADFEAALDPAYRAAEADLPGEALDWSTDRPEDLRKAYDARSRALAGDVAPDVTVSEWRAEGGRLGLAFRPREGACGAILYLHGGGWIVGSPETHAVVCSLLAARTGGSVFSADYRLAPEHRYPAQTEDAVAAVRALLASEAAATVVLAGDSAGATLCFWAWSALEPELQARIAGICGFYGVYGAGKTASFARYGPACPGLGAEDIAAYRAHLAPDADAQPPCVLEEAQGAGPPVYLSAAALDPLRDDSLALAARLSRHRRAVTLSEAARLPHGYLHFAGRVPAARAELERAAEWIAGCG